MIPTLSDYFEAKNSALFREMDEFEKEWMSRNPLRGYSILHHWSRTWEYPFAFKNLSPGKILDVGCGWSFFPSFVEKNIGGEIHLLDNDPEIVTWQENHCHFKTHLEDITNTTFPDGEFDTVLCLSTLEHVYDPHAAVKEMKRILKPGGRLILTYDINLTTMTDPLLGSVSPPPPGTLTSHNAPEGLPGRTDIVKKFISLIRRGHPLGHIPYLTVRGVIYVD